MRIFASIIKRDDEKRMVYGYASTEALDSQGERVSKGAIEKALPDYMRWANVREMHQASAVGVTKSAEIDDKGLYIQCKIVDESAWQKVKEEVYKGFSIGGKSVAKTEDTITELKLTEISLVDRPANPEAVIEVWKSADGAPQPVAIEKAAVVELAALVNAGKISPQQLLELAKKATAPAAPAHPTEKRDFSDKKRKDLADKGHALPDGSFPIETVGDLKNAIKAFGRAKDKAKAKAHIIARAKDLKATDQLPDDWKKVDGAGDIAKGLYQVSWLASLLDTIACLQRENCFEQEMEGDAASECPAALKQWLCDGLEILDTMVDEESAELMGVTRTQNLPEPDKETLDDPAKLVGALRKAFPITKGEPEMTPTWVRAELGRRAADLIEKTGAKFSAGTKAKMAEAHDHIQKAAGHLAKGRGSSMAEADAHLDKCEKCIGKADQAMEQTGYKGEDDKGKLATGDALAAAITQPAAAPDVTKALEGELAKRDAKITELTGTLTELTKRLKALEDQPQPAKGPTRVVSKEDDNGSGNAGAPAITPVLNADGSVDEAATAMKKAQASAPVLISSRAPSPWFQPRAQRR